MRLLHYSVPASLVLLGSASFTLPGCTIREQATCEGDSCAGGSQAAGGESATGGAPSEAGAGSFGGSTGVGGTSANGGTQSTASAGSSSIGGATGGTAGSATRTGGTSATLSSRTGGTSATAGTSARTGGATSTGGTSARTGGTSSTAGTSARTGGTSSLGGSRSTGGVSSTGGSGATDLCPNDPNKTTPGTCGCGVADTDADGDSVADCNDICPNNPQISKAGTISFSVVFTAAAQAYPQYLDGLRSSMIAAGNEWAKRFAVAHDVSLEVQIDIADIATANGKSADSVYVEALGGMSIYQQSAAYEILTGQDPNSADPDIEITFGIDPLSGADGHSYWFDPDPVARTATMPSNGVDAVSTCLHELGHALGFNGWRDWATGVLPDTYCSYYDYMSSTDGSDFFFDGTRAVAKYGSHVPETYGNIAHIGNLSPRPGEDLDLDLMRGTRTLLAHRYYISDVDLAILADVGLPIPGTTAAIEMCKTTPGEPRVIQLGPRPAVVE